MAEIVTKFSSDDKEMIAAFQRQQQELEKIKIKLKEAKEEAAAGGKAAKESADKGASALESMGSKVVAAASGYLTLQSAIGFVNKALQDQIDLQDKVAAVQKSTADAQIAFLRNLGNVSKKERDANLAEIAAISQRQNVSQSFVYQVASTAMSAKGGMPSLEAMKSVESAIAIAPENVAEATAIGGGLLDVASLTGTTDPARNRGLLIQMQQQGRNVTMQSVAQNLVPGAITLKAYGATTEQAAAATTSMTQAMKDPEGRLAVTALDRLAGLAEGVTPGGFDEDIMKLRSNPALRKRFMAKANFEKAEKFVEAFLTEGSETANLYDQYKSEMPTAERAGKMSAEFEQGIMSPDLQQSEIFRRKYATSAENRRLADIRSGDYSRIRGAIEGDAESARIDYFTRSFGAWRGKIAGYAGGSPEESGLSQIGYMESELGSRVKAGDPEAAKQLEVLQGIKLELMRINQRKQTNVIAPTEN